MNQGLVKQPLWTKKYIMVMVILFFLFFSAGVSLTVMSIFARNLTGVETYAGMVTSFFALGALAVRFIAGSLVDKMGTKKVIIAGIIFISIGTILFIVFDEIAFILVGRIFQGLGFGLASTALSTTVAIICHESRLLDGISYASVSMSFANVIGPPIGFWIIGSEYNRFSLLFYVTLVVLAITFLLVLFEKSEYAHVEKAVVQDASKPKVKGLIFVFPLIVLFINSLTHSSIISFLALYAISINLSGIGSFFSINAIGMLASRFVMNRLVNRYGDFPIMALNAIVFSISVLMITRVNAEYQLLIIAFPAGFTMGSIAPIVNAYVIKMMPSNRTGIANAMYYSALDVGFTIGSIAWGVVAIYIGYINMFLVAGLLQAVGAILSLIQIKVHKTSVIEKTIMPMALDD